MSCHSTHLGIAATRHARAVTDLDEAQVASIFHRLKNRHSDAPAPTAEEAIAVLNRKRREALDDPRLTLKEGEAIADRYARTITQIEQGIIPDGRTWAAMQHTVMEAEIAERNLDALVDFSARHQHKDPERLAAAFRKWRRTNDYEDMESPDPRFVPNPDMFPSDKNTARALRKMGFENYLAQPLPVFVYGTLRRNQGNDRLMSGAILERSEEAHMEGVAIYGAGWGFPYAKEAPDGQGITKGDLVHLTDDSDGRWARQRLDGLEGFNSDRFNDSHYRRVDRDVTYIDPDTGETKTTRAWVYLAGGYVRDLSEADRIHDGDWVQAKNTYRSTYTTRTVYADDYDDLDDGGWDGEYTVVKSAVDSTPSRSAEDSAAVFANAGLIDEEPDENAGFWSTQR